METYPHNLNQHTQGQAIKVKLAEEHSMLEGLPKLSLYDQNKMFYNVEQLKTESTLQQLVFRDISRMTETVKNEMSDTIGATRHRKIAPLKEAVKRIEKSTVSIK